jgi:hypothetical protein
MMPTIAPIPTIPNVTKPIIPSTSEAMAKPFFSPSDSFHAGFACAA